MANESIGGVVVSIGGDFSPLLADAKSASGAASIEGQKIGASIAQGATVASAATADFSAMVEALTTSIAEQNAVLSLSIQRNMAHAAAIRESSQAAHGAVTEIQAVGGGIRTAFGEQSIRAVERFLTTIPGVGIAMQALFPIIGAVALYDMFSRVIGKTDELKAAMDDLKSATKEADSALANLVRTGDALIAHTAGREGGPAAAAQARGTQLKHERDDIADQILGLEHDIETASIRYAALHPMRAPLSSDDIKSWNPPEVVAEREALNKKIDALVDQQAAKQAEAQSAFVDAATLRASEAGALQVKQIEAAEQAAGRFAEISKQRYVGEINAAHAAAQATIDSLTSEYERVVATGEEEIRFEKAKQDEITGYALAARDRAIKEIAAKAGAESAGKTGPEKALVAVGAESETQKANDDFTLTKEKASLDVQAARQKGQEAIVKLNEKIQQQLEDQASKGLENITGSNQFRVETSRLITEELAKRERINEIEAESGGQTQALRIEGEKVTLEGQYAAQLVHTSAQHIAFLQQIAKLEAESNAAKLKGLELERDLAEASGEIVKAAEIQARIDSERQQGINQQAKAQSGIDTAKAQSSPTAQLSATLAQWGNVKEQMNQGALQVVATLDKVPQTLAQAIVQAHGLGRAFADMGKQLATSLLTDALKVGLSAVIRGLGQVIPLFGALTSAATAAASAQKAAALASVSTAAGEGAAWGFESVMAALPFPVNVALAPEVAAATFASIEGFGAFAGGTNSAPGGMAIVGERGPEIVNLPRGSQVIPNHMLKGYADGAGVSSSPGAGGGSIHIQNLSIHAHGINDPSRFTEHVFRTIPKIAKARTSKQSPYAR